MPVALLKNADFGSQRSDLTGSAGVGYTVIDGLGNVITSRTTTGVYQLAPRSGLYAANVSFPDSFSGQILWDCPPVTSSFGIILSQSFATEQFNVSENDPDTASTWQMVNDVTGSVGELFDQGLGAWKIDKSANTMTFYREDNVSVIATFSLLDDTGTPTFNGVFERRLIGSVAPR